MDIKQFIEKIKEQLEEKSGEILVAQVIQNIKLSDDDKNEIAKAYGFQKWEKAWKILDKISEFEVFGDDDSKKIRLRSSQKNVEKNADVKNKAGNEIHNRIFSLIKYLNFNLKEKEEAIRLALLASIAGESIFFLGPPGTAKSLVSRRLRNAFTGKDGAELTYFEYLMNQFSTPDEIFGPVSLKSLENDEYKRITQGFLPDADVVFLDEIWKAGPAIQNTLLTILNEKKFHNGKDVKQVPLKALISASNELPAENQGLEAMWDRFLIRAIVNPIQNEENFLSFICGEDVKPELKPTETMLKNLISVVELEQWKKEISAIEIPDDVLSVVIAIKQEMAMRNAEKKRDEKEKFYVSDRRWKKILNILKTSAFLNGRKTVDLMDLQLVEYCIWNTESQIEESREIVKTCMEQNGLEVDTAIDDINEQITEFKKYVLKEFYKEKKEKPKLYKMADGEQAYKITSPIDVRSYNLCLPYYISETKNHEMYNRTGAYYNDAKEMIGDYDYFIEDDSVEIKGNKFFWYDGYKGNSYEVEIEMEKDGFEKDPAFKDHPDLLELRQNNADKNVYKPILQNISNELKKIDDYISEKAAPYKENLFADQKMCDVILTAVEKSRLELEKAKEDLEKVREKYIN